MLNNHERYLKDLYILVHIHGEIITHSWHSSSTKTSMEGLAVATPILWPNFWGI